MKKILLAAVALLFTVGATAQDIKLNRGSNMKPVNVTTPPLKHLRTDGNARLGLDGQVAKPMAKAVQRAATPEGTAREYMVVCGDNATGVSDKYKKLLNRAYKLTFIFAADGKTVYFNNPLYADYATETVWIKGELSADGTQLTVQAGQPLGTFFGNECVLGSIGVDIDIKTPIVFTVDAASGGLIYTEGYIALVAVQDGKALGFYTYQSGLQMIPMDSNLWFDEPVTRKYTALSYDGQTDGQEESTVEDIYCPVMGWHFIKGLMPAYPEGWMIAEDVEGSNDISIFNGQVVADDIAAFFDVMTSSSDPTLEYSSTFTYGADGSYTQDEDEVLLDYFAYDMDEEKNYLCGSSILYTGITLGAPGTSDISSVETGKGEPVATEYYDLSGRRIDAAAKGVTIRVEKYADGTSKAVKTIK